MKKLLILFSALLLASVFVLAVNPVDKTNNHSVKIRIPENVYKYFLTNSQVNFQNELITASVIPNETSISWQNHTHGPGSNNSDAPTPEFKSPKAMNLSVTLQFDTYETGQNVLEITSKIENLVTNIKLNHSKKPKCVITLGSEVYKCKISNANTTVTKYNANGMPISALVQLTFTKFKPLPNYPILVNETNTKVN